MLTLTQSHHARSEMRLTATKSHLQAMVSDLCESGVVGILGVAHLISQCLEPLFERGHLALRELVDFCHLHQHNRKHQLVPPQPLHRMLILTAVCYLPQLDSMRTGTL